MAIRWEAECCEVGPDPISGAWVTRLTSSVMTNLNIYYESPHCSPDGTRVAYLRNQSTDPRKTWPSQICVADLVTQKICVCDDDVWCDWIATSPWSGQMHYLRSNGELIRLDVTTLEKQIVQTHWPLPSHAKMWSVTPDMRYLVAAVHDWEFHFNLMRVDLKTGKQDLIYRHPYFHGHIQINHIDGESIHLQQYTGRRKNHLGEITKEEGVHKGAHHVIVDMDGKNETLLKVGEPWTNTSTGHATWVGDTGRIATPVNTPAGITVGTPADEVQIVHDDRHPEGNLICVGPQDDSPKVFPAKEHYFNHASMSKCGTYFVADCFCHGLPAPVEIVIGNLETGKSRVLVSDCGGQGGGPASSHPHPYFTSDTQRVIYNADRFGICHLHMAKLPDGFLESLG